MAGLRVLVASTAYDLDVLRSGMKRFIEQVGFESVLSDHSDIPYDHREHTHRSCIREAERCDMVVLIIGSRFGSELGDEMLAELRGEVDITDLKQPDSTWRLSITQAEALIALNNGVPVFTFVESGVYQDYRTYRRNRDQPFADQIEYASITKPGTARYIFGFIETLKRLERNNAIHEFDKIDHIYEILQKQWSGIFQRLLSESRNQQTNVRIDRIAVQLDELKALVLSAIGGEQLTVVRAALRFRRLVVFLEGLPKSGQPVGEAISQATLCWADMLAETAGVTEIENVTDHAGQWPTVLRRNGADPYLCALDRLQIDRLADEWATFADLDKATREAAYEELKKTIEPSDLGILAAQSAHPASAGGATWRTGPSRPTGLRERLINLGSGSTGEAAATPPAAE